MSDYKLVPIGPTPEWIANLKGVRIGRMESVIEDVLAAAPAVQGEAGEGVPDYINDAIDNLAHANYELSYAGYQERTRDVELIRAYVARARQPAPQPAEREIPGSYPVSGQIFFRGASNEWVLELTGSVNGTTFTARHTQPADTRPEDVAGLPALYELAPDVAGLVEALEKYE